MVRWGAVQKWMMRPTVTRWQAPAPAAPAFRPSMSRGCHRPGPRRSRSVRTHRAGRSTGGEGPVRTAHLDDLRQKVWVRNGGFSLAEGG